MARVVIDPDEVRNFIRELLRAAGEMHDGKTQIESHFRDLRDVWHDRHDTATTSLYAFRRLRTRRAGCGEEDI